MKFNDEDVLEINIRLATEYFINNSINLINDVLLGNLKVNDKDSFIEYQLNHIEKIASGGENKTFAFMQMAYYFQTGKSIAFIL